MGTIFQRALRPSHNLAPGFSGGLLTWPSSLLAVWGHWFERSRQRAALAALDEERLRDIGIDRVSAAREAAKPFWRA